MSHVVVLAVEAETLGLDVAPWIAIILAAALLVANAFFVAAEIALLAVRRARIEDLVAAGDPRAQIAQNALRELSVTFSGAQLGITMASLGLGAVAEPAVARLFDRALEATALPAGATHGVSLALALALVVFLHMVIGEMVPKNLALASAEAVALRVARTFRAFVVVLRPLIVTLNATANVLVRLVGVEPRDERGLVHTPDEIVLLLRESRREGMLTPLDARVLTSALSLGSIDAEAAMTPRVDLHALPADARARDVLDAARESGFTRFPVFHEGIDDVVGVVHVKDVLIRDDDELDGLRVADVLRPIPAVPESRDLDRLLRDMRRDRSHAVLVVDEFGGTAGLLTLEDVLEEIVGDIEDEFDPGERDVRRLGEGRWLVPGMIRPDELQRLTGLVLDVDDVETLSGYLTSRLGRLVEPGDEVTVDVQAPDDETPDDDVVPWRLRVWTLDGRRAGDVEVVAPTSARASHE